MPTDATVRALGREFAGEQGAGEQRGDRGDDERGDGSARPLCHGELVGSRPGLLDREVVPGRRPVLPLQAAVGAVDHPMVTAISTRSPAPAAAAVRAAPTRASRPGNRGVLVVAFAVAAMVSGVCIHAHAMWFDEMQAWNIARASHTLPDLLVNLRYEGHPALWYLPLYALTRVTGDPRAMQVLGWLVVMAVNAVVLFRSPFPVPVRLAIVAGYFFAFEYSVIVRSYGLGLLLLVLALSWLGRPRPAWVAGTIALSLLAWISLAGAVLAGVLAIVLAWSWWSSRAATDRAPLGCTIAVVVSGIASVLTCIPPADFHSFSMGIPNSSTAYVDPERLARALSGPWRGLMPVPSGVGRWNTNVLDQLVGSVWLQALISLSLVVVVTLVLRSHRFAFVTWIVGVAAYLVFSVIVVLPDRAHYAGEFFLLFLACVWFAYAPPGRSEDATNDRPSSGLAAVLVVVLAAQMVATVAILPPRHCPTVRARPHARRSRDT